jgi:hypothetical protein
MGAIVFVRIDPSPAKFKRSMAKFLCFVFGALLLPYAAAFSRDRNPIASFSIDLDKPFPEILEIVDEVAHAASIKGTFEYLGDEQLSGAQFQEKSQLFPPWTEPGKVFYKVRTKVLSPSHFLNSNDVGTVAVRYVVQEKSPNLTRLFIDAVFIENARHHGHASDGYVETCEFGEIGKRLKERELLQAEAKSGQQFSTESSSRIDAPAPPNPGLPPPAEQAPSSAIDSANTGDLQRVIAEQNSLLAGERANLANLEAQARRLRSAEFVRVKSERAELKVLPYAHARTLEALRRGQEVTVLARSRYWYQIRAEDGQEGWIPHALLEAQQ